VKVRDVPSSGSYQGLTHSRNRYGQYVRSRATPVNPNTTFQGAQRANLSGRSAEWRALTSTQRASWDSLAAMMSRTDALGQGYTLNGFLAYVSVNSNNQAAGNAVVSTAPAIVTPSPPLTAVVTLTAAAFSVAYTATPLAAGQRLFTFVSPQRSAGRNFEGDYRLIAVSAAAAASPANIFAAYQARLGTPAVGNRIFMRLEIYQSGFLSGPLSLSQIVA